MATTRLNLKLASPVCGKRRHYSRDEAEKHLETLRRSEQARGSTAANELVVYECKICGGAYHVGHRTR
jgi:hypothetical protein